MPEDKFFAIPGPFVQPSQLPVADAAVGATGRGSASIAARALPPAQTIAEI